MGGESSGFLTKDDIRKSIAKRGHAITQGAQGTHVTVEDVVALAGDESITLPRLCELMGVVYTEQALEETPSTNVEEKPAQLQ